MVQAGVVLCELQVVVSIASEKMGTPRHQGEMRSVAALRSNQRSAYLVAINPLLGSLLASCLTSPSDGAMFVVVGWWW